MNEGSAKQQIVEGIRVNSNILITVSDSPSVDELSAALGLTLLLNKIEKRATSIFSGAMPAAITFLDPSKTFESTVDSLRDFIIALDKEKADHLRYKVDGDVVKIFITPYRTTLSDKDLDFSQGDYNVEMVIALGVKDPDHLDKALAAHGRILHDALVTTISAGTEPSNLGSIDWLDAAASSYCEMLVSLSEALKDNEPILDEQIATALLTGIVSATDRFSNDRTSSRVMTMAAQLMAAGANQQLIAAKLQEAHDIGPRNKNPDDTDNDSDNDKSGRNDKKKNDKKAKKDDNDLRIDRSSKKSNQKEDKPAPSAQDEPKATSATDDADSAPVAEAIAVEEALTQAAPAKDVEKELADKLAEVTQPVTPINASHDELEKELNDALQEDAQPPVNGSSEQPAAEPESLAPPVVDTGMPGFEPLDVPAPKAPPVQPDPVPQPEEPQVAPVITQSASIDSRPGSSYLPTSAPAAFDTQVNSMDLGSTSAAPQATVDPFGSSSLPPLPPLGSSNVPTIKPLVPIVEQPEAPAPVNVAADPAVPTSLEEVVATPPVAADTSSMPPLPPLPDFSTLPELPDMPTPPLPPNSDQPPEAPVVPQSGAVSSDKLGDIFGDAPKDATPPKPSSPGQFTIPGQ